MEKRTVEFTLTSPMLGTVPKNKELYTDWIAAQSPDLGEELETVVDGEKGMTGFHQDENGIYVMDYFIKGYFKSTGNAYKEILKIKNLQSKITNFLFIYPRRILLKNKPDGVIERPLRAMTAQGPRVSLAKSEFVGEGTRFQFVIGLLPHGEISWKKVEAVMDFGSECIGLGQWRNAGNGQFTWKWVG